MKSPVEPNINPASYVDPNGRVFMHNGEVFRGITPEYEQVVNELFAKGIVDRLVGSRLLVETTISEERFQGYSTVLRHRRIEFPSYCVEWPFALLKKAAVQTLTLAKELLPEGMYLQDAYPWNIFFEGTTPVFIDFTSITPACGNILWPPYQQFCRFFLFPLYLHSCGRAKIARALLHDYLNGVDYRDFEKTVPFSFKMSHPMVYLKRVLPEKLGQMANRSESTNSKVIKASKDHYTDPALLERDRLRLFDDLLSDLDSITMPVEKTRWTAYYGQEAKELEHKLELVRAVLNRYDPVSVVDVGCNTGEFAIEAARHGAKVIAIDSDEQCIELLARRADSESLSILPLVLDFSNPTPSFGWSAGQFPAAHQRLSGDMVFALALIHHLVFMQRQNFERIIDGLCLYAKRWLVIEYVDISDSYIQRWTLPFERYGWYTRQTFEAILNSRFADVQLVGTVTETRFIYLCALRDDT
jgi:SAM-dependent methyltransferase